MARADKKASHKTILDMALFHASQFLPAVTPLNQVRVSPHLLELFRSHQLYSSLQDLGAGLDPLSIICAEHHNTKDVLELVQKQEAVESGTGLSLQDAQQFTTRDPRFPRSYLQAVDKLWGLVVVVRVYFGNTHDLYVGLEAAVHLIAPYIHSLETTYNNNPKQGLLVAIRILLFFRNRIFLYLQVLRGTPVGTLVAPIDFNELNHVIQMQQFELLPRVPESWMPTLKKQVPEFASRPGGDGGGGGGGNNSGGGNGGGGGGGNGNGSNAKVVNAHADSTLVSRFTAHGPSKIGDIYIGHDSEKANAPQDNGTALCLRFHLKGECKKSCPRASTHKRYGADMVTALHAHLSACGVGGSP
jgi:hypothetical protein